MNKDCIVKNIVLNSRVKVSFQYLFCLSLIESKAELLSVCLSQGAFNFVCVPYSKYTYFIVFINVKHISKLT